MNEFIEDRRNFIKRISIAAAALPLLACQSGTLAQKNDKGDILALLRKNADASGQNWTGAAGVPNDVTWKTVLATDADKGERMLISGIIYQPDGKTPAPNTLIYLYHTDVHGIYGRGSEPRHGRYRGWMLTDEKGRYEFTSIRPASYPDSTISAHVHMTLTTKDMKEDWCDVVLFDGDRFITARERSEAGKKGGFNPILKMEKGADGVMRGVRDIQLWA